MDENDLERELTSRGYIVSEVNEQEAEGIPVTRAQAQDLLVKLYEIERSIQQLTSQKPVDTAALDAFLQSLPLNEKLYAMKYGVDFAKAGMEEGAQKFTG
jgi:uncharacterized protein (UPF0128 family)